MGHDLDSLLDATGIGDMAGKQYEKTAAERESEPFDFRKLAEQCREAATSTASHREARGRELAEKTAAVAVISKTIDEINEIIGDPAEKLANDPAATEFVLEALDRGHKPEEIAAFMKSAGILDAIRGIAKGWRAGGRAGYGGRLAREGERATTLAKREYQDLLRQASRSKDLNKQQRMVERLRRKFGDEEAAKILRESGARLPVPAAKDILRSTKPPVATAEIGGKKLELSEAGAKKLKRYGIPAAAATGGIMVGRRKRKPSDEGGKGVTVIRG